MKRKLLLGTILAGALGVGYANASYTAWPFSAPVIDDEADVKNPEQGNLIFDWTSSSSGNFKGYDGSSWVALDTTGSAIPSGTIMAFGGSTAPSGWLPCDGATVSRATYSSLYSAIGDNFGEGDGSTTFHLPDLRGRFLRGVDGSVGRDPDASTRSAMNTGGNVGDSVGSVQSDDFKSHTHTSSMEAGGGSGGALDSYDGGSATTPISPVTSATGGNETRPVNASVLYIIKI